METIIIISIIFIFIPTVANGFAPPPIAQTTKSSSGILPLQFVEGFVEPPPLLSPLCLPKSKGTGTSITTGITTTTTGTVEEKNESPLLTTSGDHDEFDVDRYKGTGTSITTGTTATITETEEGKKESLLRTTSGDHDKFDVYRYKGTGTSITTSTTATITETEGGKKESLLRTTSGDYDEFDVYRYKGTGTSITTGTTATITETEGGKKESLLRTTSGNHDKFDFYRYKNFGASHLREDIDLTSSEFIDILRSSAFVDKTSAIWNFLRSWPRHLVITGPKRFGKTSILKMLQYFFSPSVHPKTGVVDAQLKRQKIEIFTSEKLNISRSLSDVRPFFMSSPVLYLSFSKIEVDSYSKFLESVQLMISEAFTHHEYLRNAENLPDSQKKENAARLYDIGITGPAKNIRKNTLAYLAVMISSFHNERVFVFIDEYDIPFSQLLFADFKTVDDEKIRDFLAKMIGSISKHTPEVARVLLTGCTRIGGTISEEATNLEFVDIFDSHKYSECFGFTRKDARYLVKKFELDKGLPDINTESNTEIDRWYDGYHCKNKLHLYCPVSLLNFLKHGQFRSYWKLPKLPVLKDRAVFKMVKKKCQQLFEKKIFTVHLEPYLTYSQLSNLNTYFRTGVFESGLGEKIDPVDWFFQYLTDSGVLCKTSFEETRGPLAVAIPNWEIETQLKERLVDIPYLSDVFDVSPEEAWRFIQSAANLHPKREESFKEFLDKAHHILIKPKVDNEAGVEVALFSTIQNTDKSEKFLSHTIQRNVYNVTITEKNTRDFRKKNLEPGQTTYKRSDISFVTNNGVAVIIELKYKEESSYRALEQILTHEYFRIFEQGRNGIAKQIKERVYIGLHFKNNITNISYVCNHNNYSDLYSFAVNLTSFKDNLESHTGRSGK